ncbi:MAG: hypothetical protein M5U29_05230 [Anaerolineae bacterium]|nr:hypothetical protein [Anaerolineae bacterium]
MSILSFISSRRPCPAAIIAYLLALSMPLTGLPSPRAFPDS